MALTADEKSALTGIGKGGIGSTIGGGIGAAIGLAMAQGNYEEAKRLQALGLEQLKGLDPESIGRIRAEMGESAFKNLTEPVEGRAAQLRALQRLEAMSTGDDPESAAAYARAQAEAAANERGVRMAALQRLAQRGVGATSGLALAAQQDAAQASTQTAATRDLEVAAEARRRALQAAGQITQAAGGLRGDDYRAASDRAKAQDIINQFNAGQRLRQGESLYGAQERQADRLYDAYGNQAKREEEEGGRKVATATAMGKGLGAGGDAAMMAFGGGF